MTDHSDTMLASSPLIAETRGRLRILTLNRPDSMNALTPELHGQLRLAVMEASEEAKISAVVLTGNGRGFCAGGDIKVAAKRAKTTKETVEERQERLRDHAQTTACLHHMPKVTIALVNGAAAGAGLSLALACDLRIAVSSATFKTAYAQIGLSGDLGISYFLTRLVGPQRARQLMLFSEKIAADRALELGLIDLIIDKMPDQIDELEWIRLIATGPSVALRAIKENLLASETESLQAVTDLEAHNAAKCSRTADVKEAAASFREKRPPRFTGT
ncbi:MAG: enoyl-CoA hydratase [Halieaceae bacterium]|nr:enoyl-CoA hydratase [Halieaceae bacterium]